MLVKSVADLLTLVMILTAVNVNCCVFVCLSSQIIVDVTLQSHVQCVRFIETTLRMKDNTNYLRVFLFLILLFQSLYLFLSGFRIISEFVLADE